MRWLGKLWAALGHLSLAAWLYSGIVALATALGVGAVGLDILNVPQGLGAILGLSAIGVSLIGLILALRTDGTLSFDRVAIEAELSTPPLWEIKELLGTGHDLGGRLWGVVTTRDDPRINQWGNLLNTLVEAAFGEGEATMLFSDFGFTFYVATNVPGTRDQAQNYIKGRQLRLEALMGRLHTVPIRPDFAVERWRGHFAALRDAIQDA